MKRLAYIVCVTLALAGCASNSSQTATAEKKIREKADYWQRSDDVSALYVTGPKAQHLLNQDIASCVAEVRELVRLGSIRKAEPPSNIGMDQGLRQGWQSPTRDGPLYTEYTAFQDFDGCMKNKGWERVDFVRPVVAQAATRNYTHTILGRTFGWTAPRSDDGDASQNNNFNQ